jgi:hypothetical protein
MERELGERNGSPQGREEKQRSGRERGQHEGTGYTAEGSRALIRRDRESGTLTAE